jgi:hypothetical protein
MSQQHIAKIVNYGLQETKNGNVMAVVQFEFFDDGQKHKLSWRGSFNGGALEWTVKTLLVCGLVGNDPSVIADGPESGALNMDKEFNITVKSETGSDGKLYWKVAWVNEAGFSNSLSRSSAVAKLGDLRAQVASYRKETGYDQSKENLKSKREDQKLEELPF